MEMEIHCMLIVKIQVVILYHSFCKMLPLGELVIGARESLYYC